jgi:membrane dipeptidase
MFPDLAHMSDKAMGQAVAASEGPVVCSHTGMRALCDRPRNLADAEARRIAATGGMIGIAWYAPMLTPGRSRNGATLDTFLDHCCHAAMVVGAGRVGIGTDLDAAIWTPAGLRDHGDFPRILHLLGDDRDPA